MKLLTTLTLASLLSGGAAFAAGSSASTPTAAAGTATPATMTAKHHSAMYCEKQARHRKLSGDAEKSYVKDCRAGRKTD